MLVRCKQRKRLPYPGRRISGRKAQVMEERLGIRIALFQSVPQARKAPVREIAADERGLARPRRAADPEGRAFPCTVDQTEQSPTGKIPGEYRAGDLDDRGGPIIHTIYIFTGTPCGQAEICRGDRRKGESPAGAGLSDAILPAGIGSRRSLRALAVALKAAAIRVANAGASIENDKRSREDSHDSLHMFQFNGKH